MKIDLVGPHRSGFAMGLNEAARYGAGHGAGHRLHRLKMGAATRAVLPWPRHAAIGLSLSVLFVRETHLHVAVEAANHTPHHDHLLHELTGAQIFTLTSFRDDQATACSPGVT